MVRIIMATMFTASAVPQHLLLLVQEVEAVTAVTTMATAPMEEVATLAGTVVMAALP